MVQNLANWQFVDENMKLSRKSTSEFGPNKKSVYLSLTFESDIKDEILTKRLTHVVKSTFYAGTVRLHFTSSSLLHHHLKDEVSAADALYCVYCLNCSCGAWYIGRTTRHLSERTRKHHPARLGNEVINSINRSFCARLADSNHTVQTSQAFRPIYSVRGTNLSSFVTEFSQLRNQWKCTWLTHFYVPRNSPTKL